MARRSTHRNLSSIGIGDVRHCLVVLATAPLVVGLVIVLHIEAAHAGQIYGQITNDGRTVGPGIPIVIDCALNNRDEQVTDMFGSYRAYLPRTGDCNVTVTYGGSPITLSRGARSYDEPVRYDFDIVGTAPNYSLRRR
ncbi:MAG: hypothetical protein GY791_14815 [Alphaproteobacteria bacterium]|nr:hypothetical protein [Alphaproteobacteria bacterium]